MRDLELPAEESPAVGVDEGPPERFDPKLMHGRLIEAEHFGRYWWAAQLVKDKRVLDAGCGTGYGSSVLAEGGAAEVVGVDVDEDMLEVARGDIHPSVRLTAADIRQLPFEDDSFDTIVCFETIEHVEQPDRALEEFARVLGDGGLLVISSPNREVYPPGNPHHRHEYVPEELEAALGEHFANVRLFRQHDWFASAVFDDTAYGWDAEDPVKRVEVRKVVGRPAGSELYTLALASATRLPRPASLAVLTHTAELREISKGFEEVERRRREVAAEHDILAELRASFHDERAATLKEVEDRRREVAAEHEILAELRASFQDERAATLKEVARLQSDAAATRERDAALVERMLELEAELANARQASEQDAHDAEEARATAEQVQAEFKGLHAELARLHAELDRLSELMQAMRSTRVWRLGESLWRFKAALLRRPSDRP